MHFDLELAKKQSLENPVYYIQYAYARILNILKFAKNTRSLRGDRRSIASPVIARLAQSAEAISKTGSQQAAQSKSLYLSLLNKTEELNLIQTLGKFPLVVQSCTLNLEPHRITTYLQELAKNFHHYYEKHRVAMQDPELTCARLVLIDAVRIVLNNGLRLLAVSAPEKM